MRKGFGLYSPHETTVFFLKALLLSFWAGVDLIAALVVSALPAGGLAQHGFLMAIALAVLISGTVFSALFAWATGSLFASKPIEIKGRFIAKRLHNLKQQPYQLIGAGVAGTSVLAIAITAYLIVSHAESDPDKRLGRATAAVSRKCSEIASLEQKLFQSDEQAIMAECLIQYDEKYASLRRNNLQGKH